MRVTRSDIRDQPDGYKYDTFYVCEPGSYGHPDVNPGERQPAEGWLDKARQAMSWGADARVSGLVSRVARMFE